MNLSIAAQITAALFLWIAPCSNDNLTPQWKLAANFGALIVMLSAWGEIAASKEQRKQMDLHKLINEEVGAEWADLEIDRQVQALRQEYGKGRPTPIVVQPESEPEFEFKNPFAISSTAAKLMQSFEDFKIDAAHDGEIKGASIIRHKIKPGKGVQVKKIKGIASDLKVALSLPTCPVITEQPGYVAIDIPCDRTVLNFADYITPELRPNDSPVMMALGVDILGLLVEGNISEPGYSHGLAGGMSGSGKTELLIASTLSLTKRYSPDLVKFVIHTTKSQDFRQPYFEAGLNNPYQWRAVSRSAMEALEIVRDLVIEMRGRNQFLADNYSKNIDEHNRKFPDAPMSHIVFHFDEVGATMLELKKWDEDSKDEKDLATGKALKTAFHKEMTLNLRALAKEARASGIHLFCWDQKPSEKTIDTDTRSELGLRVCLKVQDAEASKMVINLPIATELLGKGDMLADIEGQLQRLQGLYVGPELLQVDPSWPTQPPATPQPAAPTKLQPKPGLADVEEFFDIPENPPEPRDGGAKELLEELARVLPENPTDQELISFWERISKTIVYKEKREALAKFLRLQLGLN